jgi:hypothetical protein
MMDMMDMGEERAEGLRNLSLRSQTNQNDNCELNSNQKKKKKKKKEVRPPQEQNKTS